MDLHLTDVQEELWDSFGQLLAKGSSPEQVRGAEPLGFDRGLWATLVETGVVVMGVPEEQEGWGASLLDLALVAEQVGRAVAPAPVVETQVAARLLAALDSDAARTALADVLSDERMITLALHRAVDGVAGLVPAGAVCDAVIVPEGDRLMLVEVDDSRRTGVDNLASAPLADVRVDGGVELAAGAGTGEAFERAVDEWMTLSAAAVVGASQVALDLACEYAVERTAFGKPIGAFQGVAHPLADDATAVDGARLLARKAAWAIDGGAPDRGRELASMAFAFASTAAEKTTYDALHVHGGYGFMLEYDVQLYYRRVRGWTRVWGDAEAAHLRVADARYATAASQNREER